MDQAGAAGAEVVEDDLHAQLAALRDHEARHRAVELGAVLGQLQRQQPGRALRVLGQHAAQVGEKLRIEKMPRADVDADLQRAPRTEPGVGLAHGRGQHETAYRHGQGVVVEHGLESRCAVQSRCVAQPQQGFGAVDLHLRFRPFGGRCRLQRQNGLILQLQPVVAQCRLHPLQLAVALLHGVFHLLVEDAVLLSAVFLRRVHGHVGPPHQGFGVDGRIGLLYHQTERQPDLQAVALNDERRFDAVHQPFGDVAELLLGAVAGQQHHELIAAETGQQIALAQHTAQPLPHGDQQLIANDVAQPVIDGFEAVEIHQPDGQRLGRVALHQLVEVIEKDAAIGQPGQLVAQGETAQRLERLGQPQVVLDERAAEAFDGHHERGAEGEHGQHGSPCQCALLPVRRGQLNSARAEPYRHRAERRKQQQAGGNLKPTHMQRGDWNQRKQRQQEQRPHCRQQGEEQELQPGVEQQEQRDRKILCAVSSPGEVEHPVEQKQIDRHPEQAVGDGSQPGQQPRCGIGEQQPRVEHITCESAVQQGGGRCGAVVWVLIRGALRHVQSGPRHAAGGHPTSGGGRTCCARAKASCCVGVFMRRRGNASGKACSARSFHQKILTERV